MKGKIIYQLSTHWDREWYKPFQEFRYYLVEMIDALIDALENGKITTFTLDGQLSFWKIILKFALKIRTELQN